MKSNLLLSLGDWRETAQYKKWDFWFHFYLLGHIYAPEYLDMKYTVEETVKLLTCCVSKSESPGANSSPPCKSASKCLNAFNKYLSSV